MGSCCGAVGIVIASNSRDPRFESSHQQYYLLSTALKTVMKRRKWKKETGNGPNLKNLLRLNRFWGCVLFNLSCPLEVRSKDGLCIALLINAFQIDLITKARSAKTLSFLHLISSRFHVLLRTAILTGCAISNLRNILITDQSIVWFRSYLSHFLQKKL